MEFLEGKVLFMESRWMLNLFLVYVHGYNGWWEVLSSTVFVGYKFQYILGICGLMGLGHLSVYVSCSLKVVTYLGSRENSSMMNVLQGSWARMLGYP